LRVLDVGANPIEGDAPYKSLLAAGRATVTGFEPQDGARAELEAKKGPHETYRPEALGSGGPGVLNLYAHSGFASLFKVDEATARLIGYSRGTKTAGSLPVTTSRADDITALGRVDFLKIDVQGAELSIISNARSTLAEAVLVQSEVRFLPLYRDEPSFGDLAGELAEQGFAFHDFAFLKRLHLRSKSSGQLRPRAARQVLDGDAYFIRDLRRSAEMSDAQLWRLALLADAVVESPGLAVFCLDALTERGAAPADAATGYVRLLPERLRAEAANA
jgi:FkbM family methyltransferase